MKKLWEYLSETSRYRKFRMDQLTTDTDLEAKLAKLMELIREDDTPNINVLWRIAKDIDAIKLNLKFFGYDLAEQMREALPSRHGLQAQHVGLKSQVSTQADLSSDWAAYWADQLKIGIVFHRKVWELCYVMQAIYEHDLLKPGSRGLGFGCGEEPIPSLLTSMGVNVTITDLDPRDAAASGWLKTDQHTSTLDHCHMPNLVSIDEFHKHAELQYVDMNNIPKTLQNYDFNWSICALEHIGSIAKGLNFIENSLNTLHSGGLAVHTTEFNFTNDNDTIDNWGTVLFQRKHFSELAERLRAKGHWVAELDFSIGNGPLDKFIDLPPFEHDYPESMHDWSGISRHLKVMVDGFPSTCFGMIVKKA